MKDASTLAIAPRTSSGGISFIALWTLYTLTFRQHLHGRRWIVMGVLFLLPPALKQAADRARGRTGRTQAEVLEEIAGRGFGHRVLSIRKSGASE
jgi:hypothetical protein